MKEFLKKHWILIVSLIYLLWPLDIIPDIFGPVGLIDDFSLLAIVFLRELIIFYKEKKALESKKDSNGLLQ
ncbi:MAG: DUF1232 domain-containing protein [bacterium]